MYIRTFNHGTPEICSFIGSQDKDNGVDEIWRGEGPFSYWGRTSRYDCKPEERAKGSDPYRANDPLEHSSSTLKLRALF